VRVLGGSSSVSVTVLVFGGASVVSVTVFGGSCTVEIEVEVMTIVIAAEE